MARTRDIKPAFFNNEELSELKPLSRLLFIGLWCLADREGRLEDRPKRIKKEILGYDTCNCDSLLQSLHDSGFIDRYCVNDCKYIQIVNFAKHQKPHPNETKSVIPAKESANGDNNVSPWYDASTTMEVTNNAYYPTSPTSPTSLSLPLSHHGESESESKKRFKPPTVDEVAQYCEEQGHEHVNAEQFISFYGSKGWRVGKDPMVSWRKAVAGWNSRKKNELSSDNRNKNVFLGAD